jgi:hypothetical protein
MANNIDVFCSTCFALPGESCRTKFLVHGRDEVTPVICCTHSVRLVDSQRKSMRKLFAQQLLLVALKSLGDR